MTVSSPPCPNTRSGAPLAPSTGAAAVDEVVAAGAVGRRSRARVRRRAARPSSHPPGARSRCRRRAGRSRPPRGRVVAEQHVAGVGDLRAGQGRERLVAGRAHRRAADHDVGVAVAVGGVRARSCPRRSRRRHRRRSGRRRPARRPGRRRRRRPACRRRRRGRSSSSVSAMSRGRRPVGSEVIRPLSPSTTSSPVPPSIGRRRRRADPAAELS